MEMPHHNHINFYPAMKKFLLITCVLMSAAALWAQPTVTSAYNANDKGDYESAVKYIEQAMSDPKATSKEKTFRYRASIYINVAKDSMLAPKYPNALRLAHESLMKAMELDSRNDYEMENKVAMAEVQTLANNAGIDEYTAGDYAGAAKNFGLSLEISEHFNLVDTLSIYNTALCNDKSGNVDEAIKGYLRCGDINYNVPNVYLFASNLETARGNSAAAIEIIRKGRAKYPREKDLILEEINFYLEGNKYAEAEQNLKTAIELDPKNEILQFALGTVYENLAKPKEAEEAYKAAIALKPDYFDPLFNLGASYFNKAVEIDHGCDDIPPSQKDKYAECGSKANVEFEKALPYLEKAHDVNPSDQVTMRSLKDIYFRMERMTDYNRIKGQLGEY